MSLPNNFLSQEFFLIKKYFKNLAMNRDDVIVGIGDDAAVVQFSPEQQYVISTDTLVAGTHFLANTSAYDIGYKSLAVNLSDMAAMGAEPLWVSLALTLPDNNEEWIKLFSAGFFALCDEYHLSLIGGDLTRGPLTITVTIHGRVPFNQALLRSGAKVGDEIYVTGFLGDAGLALQHLLKNEEAENILSRLNRPIPRVKEGLSLRGLANTAIDISDGLAADLMHILEESQVGASIQLEHLPLSTAMRSEKNNEKKWVLALTAGDDYELCFTIPLEKQKLLAEKIQQWQIPCTRIGVIEAEPGLRMYQSNGVLFTPKKLGYQHFEN